MAVKFSPAARQDIRDIGDYIYAENPKAANQLVAKLRERCIRLAEMPRLGILRPELRADIRSVVLGSYVILYALDSKGGVRIERVLHGARDLGHIFEGPSEH